VEARYDFEKGHWEWQQNEHFHDGSKVCIRALFTGAGKLILRGASGLHILL